MQAALRVMQCRFSHGMGEPRSLKAEMSDWGLGIRLGDIRFRIVISDEVRNFCQETHAFPICAAHLSAFLICLSCRLCPIRPYGQCY